MVDLSVNIAGIKLKNPVLVASGTFGFEKEYLDLIDINKLGAYITKTITLKPKEGNPPPRIVETPAGMLNSIGLQNKGVENFIEEGLPQLSKFDIPIIVSIAGETIDEFEELTKILDKQDISALELNVSCPNVKKGGMQFGIDPQMVAEVVKTVKTNTKKPIITKLSPNVTDIKPIALAAQNAGSDAMSLINTLLGMVIDIHTRKPKLSTGTGGLSGPAIKPIALRMVYEVYRTVKIPILGMGGISSGEDAIEFILAGATAVAIGTANFVDPKISLKVIEGIKKYLEENSFKHVSEIIGKIKLP